MGMVEEAGPGKHVSPGLADGVLEHKGTPIWRSALLMGWLENIGPAPVLSNSRKHWRDLSPEMMYVYSQ